MAWQEAALANRAAGESGESVQRQLGENNGESGIWRRRRLKAEIWQMHLKAAAKLAAATILAQSMKAGEMWHHAALKISGVCKAAAGWRWQWRNAANEMASINIMKASGRNINI